MSVTRQEFRRWALSLPRAEAKSHMGHPDFRVSGKIFATLGYPDNSYGMVTLTPVEQQMFVAAEPNAFRPCAGKWGERGATNVKLPAVRKSTLRRALGAAWELASTLAKPTPTRSPVHRRRSARNRKR